MSGIVDYKQQDQIATITMNDGSKNLISPKMLSELNKVLDQAEKDKAVVVLTGQEGIFSAGFDLKILKKGVTDAFKMLIGGFELSHRLLGFPMPVVIACSGHAVAMGSFLLLSADYSLCSKGAFKIVANEVAIGLTLPYAAIEICRQRLTPAHFVRTTLLSETYNPESAVNAGFIDRVVAPNQLMEEALKLANEYTKLDLKAHYESKMRVRSGTLSALKSAINADKRDFVMMGVKRFLKI